MTLAARRRGALSLLLCLCNLAETGRSRSGYSNSYHETDHETASYAGGVQERLSYAEAIPADSIAMGAARNERHIMPRRCHSPAEIPPTAPAAIIAIRGLSANYESVNGRKRPRPGEAFFTGRRLSSRDIFKNIHRNFKGLINYYINGQIPFPANLNQYRFNNEFISNQKL
jgi:hypothetical protein